MQKLEFLFLLMLALSSATGTSCRTPAGYLLSLVQQRANTAAALRSESAAGAAKAMNAKAEAKKGDWKVGNKPVMEEEEAKKRSTIFAATKRDSVLVNLDFEHAKLTHNNLGGQGPDSGGKRMVFQNVAVFDGKNISLIVQATDSYAGNIEKNVIEGSFGQINLAPGTSTKLLMSFVDSGTGELVELPAFTMSFWDMDSGKNGQGVEKITVSPIVGYYTTADTEVIAVEVKDDTWLFTASQSGSMGDNPWNISNLSPLQMNRAVAVELTATAQFWVTLEASENNWGRTFMFGGNSRLRSIDNRNLVGPCSDRLKLNFTNASGNLGPETEGMRLSTITKVDGKAVDMIVKADENYQANNASQNGVGGSLMNINLADNVTTLVNFSFVDAETNEPVSLSRFFFVILDIDQTLHGFEEVIMKSADYADYWTSAKSSVQVTDMGNVVKFRSSEWGNASDIPLKPLGLSPVQAGRTAVFWIDEPVSYFSLTLRTYNIYTGRNFAFSTDSDLICPKLT